MEGSQVAVSPVAPAISHAEDFRQRDIYNAKECAAATRTFHDVWVRLPESEWAIKVTADSNIASFRVGGSAARPVPPGFGDGDAAADCNSTGNVKGLDFAHIAEGKGVWHSATGTTQAWQTDITDWSRPRPWSSAHASLEEVTTQRHDKLAFSASVPCPVHHKVLATTTPQTGVRLLDAACKESSEGSGTKPAYRRCCGHRVIRRVAAPYKQPKTNWNDDSRLQGPWMLDWSPDGAVLLLFRQDIDCNYDPFLTPPAAFLSLISWRRSVTAHRVNIALRGINQAWKSIMAAAMLLCDWAKLAYVGLQQLPGWVWRHRPYQPVYMEP